jgi:predicted nucleic acid-binding protein
MILPDSSFWIEYFKSGSKVHFPKGVLPEEIWTTPPIIQEVLQGIREEFVKINIQNIFGSFHNTGNLVSLEEYIAAADLYRLARKNGKTIRSSNDCLIAAIAMKHSLTVLHRDRDFSILAKLSNLQTLQF